MFWYRLCVNSFAHIRPKIGKAKRPNVRPGVFGPHQTSKCSVMNTLTSVTDLRLLCWTCIFAGRLWMSSISFVRRNGTILGSLHFRFFTAINNDVKADLLKVALYGSATLLIYSAVEAWHCRTASEFFDALCEGSFIWIVFSRRFTIFLWVFLGASGLREYWYDSGQRKSYSGARCTDTVICRPVGKRRQRHSTGTASVQPEDCGLDPQLDETLFAQPGFVRIMGKGIYLRARVSCDRKLKTKYWASRLLACITFQISSFIY